MSLEAQKHMSAARLHAMYLRPYFTSAIYAHILVEEPRVKTLAVDEHKRLYWSPEWVLRHSVEEVAAVILHEIGHSLRLHCDRSRMAGTSRTNMELVNTAQDAEINDDLRSEHRELGDIAKLPGDPLYPEKFGEPEGKTWEHYYDALRRKMDKNELPFDQIVMLGGSDEPDDEPQEKGRDGESEQGSSTLVVHDCGSGAHGVPREWDRPVLDGPDGGREGAMEAVDDADWHQVMRATAEAIIERQKSLGDVAGSWVEWADKIVKPPTVPWDRLLSAGLRRTVSDVAGMVFPTYRRPGRRAHAMPDFIVPSMRKPRPVVVIVGDTSASMQKEELALVRGVTEDVCRSLGADVAFLATDTKVHGGVQRIRPNNSRAIEFRGRGGTNMAAGIKFAMTHIRPAPDVVVVVTDCGTPWPVAPPKRARVIVCGTGGAEKKDAPGWARFIQVDPTNTSERYKK